MSKVICDVCGTTYPDTAAQCPICNSAKSSADNTAAGKGESASGYTSVKGGRFSKKNVKKRGKTTAQRRSSRQGGNQDEPSNTGLVIVVVLLLLAIIAVVIYIGVRFFGTSDKPNDNNVPGASGSQTTGQTQESASIETTQDQGIPCEALQLSNQILEFTEAGQTWTLVVAVTPVDTTDSVSFVSSDENVVTVSSNGVITAVGGGEASVIVSCGDIAAGCQITCSFENPTDPAETTEPVETTQPSEPTGEFDFKWNTAYVDDKGVGDVSLGSQGKTWTCYKSSLSVNVSDITWTSDDESVCTVKDGVVTAVGHGTTKIHASYNGVTYDCIIRCTFSETADTATEATEATQSGETTEATQGSSNETTEKCTINKTDVTIKVGESFTLTLKDSGGNVLDVEWTANGDNVTISGNTITGAASGTVTVSVTYGGETYSCIVRVTG